MKIALNGKRGSGKFSLIDDEEYNKVSRALWSVNGSGYATAFLDGVSISMHRLIMNAPAGMQVDHINGDKLDNRKCNLRLCTKSQNQANLRKYKNNGIKYKGVEKKIGGWQAKISQHRHPFYLGTYKTQEDAAHIYDAAARYIYKDFASLNFPDQNLFPNFDLEEHMKNLKSKRTSKYRGVSVSAEGKWKAKICVNYVETHLGTFETEIEAARAYDIECIIHGLTDRLNFDERTYL